MAIVEDYIVRDKSRRGLQAVANSFRAAGAGILVAGAAIGFGLFKAVQESVNLTESMQKAQQVFRGSTSIIHEFAQTSARSFFISKSAAFEYTSTLGLLLKNVGETEESAAKMSVTLVQLAADLASFNNTTTAEALQRLFSGLVGEPEAVRRFGIDISDATLRMKAFELGIYDGSGALTHQQRVIAAYHKILEDTTDAQGDSARTANELANRWRRLLAELSDFAGEIGTVLQPIILAAVSDIFTNLDSLRIWFYENKEPIQETIRNIGSTAREWFGHFLTGVKTVFEFLRDNEGTVTLAIAAIGIALAAVFGPIGVATVAIIGAIALLGRYRDNFGKLRLDILTIGKEVAKSLATFAVTAARVIVRGFGFLNRELPLLMAEIGLNAGAALVNALFDRLRKFKTPAFSFNFGPYEVTVGEQRPFAGLKNLDVSGATTYLSNLRASQGNLATRIDSIISPLEGQLHGAINRGFDPHIRAAQITVYNIDKFGSDEAAAAAFDKANADTETLFGSGFGQFGRLATQSDIVG